MTIWTRNSLSTTQTWNRSCSFFSAVFVLLFLELIRPTVYRLWPAPLSATSTRAVWRLRQSGKVFAVGFLEHEAPSWLEGLTDGLLI